jgi:hypothetical protein
MLDEVSDLGDALSSEEAHGPQLLDAVGIHRTKYFGDGPDSFRKIDSDDL